MGIFSIDSPLMRGMSKVADLMILNLIVIVTCIPIITIGASMSAMHYCLIKIHKDEGTSVVKMYFSSFKSNFVQGTALWFINIAVIALFAYDIYVFFYTPNTLPPLVLIFVVAVGVIVMMTTMYFYPLQARFVNTVGRTIRNSFFVMVLNFPKSILMIIIYALPVAIVMISQFFVPMLFLFGVTVPGYFAVKLYSKVFAKIEPQEAEITDDMDFRVEDEQSVN